MSYPIERLESRHLLSVSVESALLSDGVLPATRFAALAVPAAAPAAPIQTIQLDATAVRDQLIHFVDTWNGGQLGKLGTKGMGTYAATWDGLFRTNLDRQFNTIHYYTDDQ